jgi:L-fuculose-phosphate aldolase
MSTKTWKSSEDVVRLFQTVGRASLLYDIQNSHSGNMAIRYRDEAGNEWIVVTATGSQKGDLDSSQICFLSPTETDFGYYKASSETDIHARILSLQGVAASMHAHTKDLTIVTLDEAAKPSQPAPFIPVDPLGHFYLGVIPVDWVGEPSGSAEMARIIPERLSRHPATVIQTHGTFTRGRTLKEAFFLACIANNSGYIVRLLHRLGVDVNKLRRKIDAEPDSSFAWQPPAYTIDDDERCDFPEEKEIRVEFQKTGARIFESRLSPFHTGSISVRSMRSLLYAPKASMPREIGGPLLEVPLKAGDADSTELQLHKQIYAACDFQTIIHCYVPEAEAHSHWDLPGQQGPASRVVPIDTEGSFLYLVIPVVPGGTSLAELVRLLHDYKVVVVRGGGAWAVGQQSLSEALHHLSSLREICLYRIGAFEFGLDVRRMEPKKAKRW